MSIPGNHDVYRSGVIAARHDVTNLAKFRPYYQLFANKLARNSPPVAYDRAPRVPCFALSRVVSPDGRPLGYVAVVGFDSNWEEYDHDFIENYGRVDKGQLDQFKTKLMPEFTKVAFDAPLYVIASIHHHLLPIENKHIKQRDFRSSLNKFKELKTAGKIKCDEPFAMCVANQWVARNTMTTTTNATELIEFFQRNRISIVLHGHMHDNAVQEVFYHHFLRDVTARSVTVLACPSFAGGTDDQGYQGLVKLGLDLDLGQAHIDALCIARGQKDPPRPIQVTRPLISASRVTAAENRLYRKLKSYLRALSPTQDTAVKDRIEGFDRWVDECMRTFGYTPVCSDTGDSLEFLVPERHQRYFLLLLLREDQTYSILLNRHVPLRLSQLADWDTLLLPAFNSIHDLLRRLHDDMLRQKLEMADDSIEAQNVSRRLEDLAKLIGIEALEDQDVWTSSIRFVASKKLIKFSPTEGVPTEYDYTLVTLEPLVADEPSGRDDPHSSGRSEEAMRGYAQLRALVNNLPRVTADTDLPDSQAISIEAIQQYGAGLRWNPAAADNPRRLRQMPQGAIWFPIRRPNEKGPPHWRLCPSILARNADVMTWVDNTLSKVAADSGGAFPPELLLGKWRGEVGDLFRVGWFPFQVDAGEPPVDENGHGRSTVEALRLVRYEPTFDLHKEVAYGSKPKVMRAILKKSQPDRYGRCVIQVFEVGPLERVEEPFGKFLGVLRPVQRYVLEAGLKRAERINNEVLDKMDEDPWGFVRVKLPASFEPLAVTPPILEELDPSDWEGRQREFVVCDGNHRIVQRVWNSTAKEKDILQAVVILGKPRHPFYAKPFSKYEWHITAENRLVIPPDTPSKYAVRTVSVDLMRDLVEPSKKILESKLRSERYRRYFRDLTIGFGYMGGQGGRPA